jgi:hypothetical protein
VGLPPLAIIRGFNYFETCVVGGELGGGGREGALTLSEQRKASFSIRHY